MTTTVIVKARPAKALDGRQLEVVVEAVDTNADGDQKQTTELARMQAGEERGDFHATDTRQIVVSERPKAR